MSEQATNIKTTTWITMVLMMTGIAVVAAVYWDQHITIQKVEVNELYFTEQEQILQVANAAIGVKPDSLDLNMLTKQLQQLNYVETVIPYVEPNGKLKLAITEREPLALLVSGSDRIYVDEDGIKLPVLTGKIKNVPLVYGFDASSSADTLENPSFLQVRDFLVEAKSNGFGWATISEVAFDDKEGVVALSHQNGVKLLFGTDDFQTKLENWEAFYAQVIKTKGIEAMRHIDLRYKNQVITNEI